MMARQSRANLSESFLAIGDIDYGLGWIMAEQPRRQGDRSRERFQMTRRDVDDEPSYASIANRLQLGRHHLDMPARQKGRARVQLGEAAQHEGMEIRTQHRLIFGLGETRS